jgi:hypothetical protein
MEAAKAEYESKSFLSRLVDAHGWRYVALVFCVYGINQGAGEGWLFFAEQYWLTDPPLDTTRSLQQSDVNGTVRSYGLGLSPARYAEIDAVTNIPWQVKALYGVASDVLPVFGYHKTPYVVMSSLTGVFSFLMLYSSPLALSAAGSALLLFLANLSIASPDVMIDGSIAEKSSEVPYHAADLQSLCWISFGLVKIVSLLIAPWVFDLYGARALFGLCTLTAAAVAGPSLFNWMGEVRDKEPAQETAFVRLKRFASHESAGPFVKLAFYLSAISLTMGVVAMRGSHAVVSSFAMFVVTPLTCYLIYRFESQVDRDLAKFSLYLFLSGAVQPSAPVLFYWMKADDENCSRGLPCFSPEFIANLSIVGYVTFVIGTWLYNRYLTKVSYKRIYAYTQVGMFLLNIIDLFWVNRWNIAIGLSDEAFVLGDEVISPMVSRWNTMPMLILSAVLCPPDIYATFFALNMGISNFGGTLGEYFGVGLMLIFKVEAHQYDALPGFVIARSLFRLLPLLMIPWLLPQGSPDTPPARAWDDPSAGGTTAEKRYRPADVIAATEMVSLTKTGASGQAAVELGKLEDDGM